MTNTNYRLKTSILRTGLKSNFIAEQISISPFRLSRLVNEHVTPTDVEKIKLIDILNLPSDFFGN